MSNLNLSGFGVFFVCKEKIAHLGLDSYKPTGSSTLIWIEKLRSRALDLKQMRSL